MAWTDAGQIVITAIASVGGAGVIIVALSSWLGKIWAERLAIKQKAEMDKELARYIQELKMEVEQYRAKAEQFNFVTKLQFETEFKAYQILFEHMYHADVSTRSLLPWFDSVPEDKEKEKQLYNDRFEAHDIAIKPFYETIDQHAAFINLEIYEKLVNIGNIIHKVKIMAKSMVRNYIKKGYLGEYDKINQYNEELNKAVKDIRTDVRVYLSTLKVQG